MVEYSKVKCSHGVEMSYVEYGKENKEVLVMGGYYFHTFAPLLQALSKRYHTIGVVMRLDDSQPVSKLAADGLPDWKEQWVVDITKFLDAMNINEFTYLGKCHGTFPFWGLYEALKGRIKTAILLSPVPGAPPKEFLAQQALMMNGTIKDFVQEIVRKPENIELKIEEMMSVDSKAIGTTPHQFSLEGKSEAEMKQIFNGIEIPTLILSASDDSMLDWNFLKLLYSNVKDCKVVLYQGEKHLFEMDIPEKITADVFLFTDQIGKDC